MVSCNVAVLFVFVFRVQLIPRGRCMQLDLCTLIVQYYKIKGNCHTAFIFQLLSVSCPYPNNSMGYLFVLNRMGHLFILSVIYKLGATPNEVSTTQ